MRCITETVRSCLLSSALSRDLVQNNCCHSLESNWIQSGNRTALLSPVCSPRVQVCVCAHYDRLPAGYPGLDAASLRDCLLEQDIFGQNVLHITAKSKAAGIARLFIRQRRSSMSNGTSRDSVLLWRCVSYVGCASAVAVKNTLRLLRLGSMEDDGPLQFTALNHATDVRFSRSKVHFALPLWYRYTVQNFDQRVMLALGRLIAGSQLEGHPFDFLDWVNTPDVLGVTPLHLAAQV